MQNYVSVFPQPSNPMSVGRKYIEKFEVLSGAKCTRLASFGQSCNEMSIEADLSLRDLGDLTKRWIFAGKSQLVVCKTVFLDEFGT